MCVGGSCGGLDVCSQNGDEDEAGESGGVCLGGFTAVGRTPLGAFVRAPLFCQGGRL